VADADSTARGTAAAFRSAAQSISEVTQTAAQSQKIDPGRVVCPYSPTVGRQADSPASS
jgi:hypothetical protein